ncbi:MAG: hypothetical protein PUD20_01870 [bacterium]|nr:hypothetical protein [bacterium]
MILPFFTIFIVILIFLGIKRHKADALARQTDEDFWKTEQEANWVRKKNIDDLDYIKIPFDSFPIGKYSDPVILACEQELKELSGKLICNLNGISNTQLKLTYGPANLDTLSQCDTNYSTLVSLLANYSEQLFALGDYTNAETVAEYAVSIGSDVGKTFELLASIYAQTNDTAKLEALQNAARNLHSIRRNSILRKLGVDPDTASKQ